MKKLLITNVMLSALIGIDAFAFTCDAMKKPISEEGDVIQFTLRKTGGDDISFQYFHEDAQEAELLELGENCSGSVTAGQRATRASVKHWLHGGFSCESKKAEVTWQSESGVYDDSENGTLVVADAHGTAEYRIFSCHGGNQ
jgi:hypothetical protein